MNPQPGFRTTHAAGGLDHPLVYDRWGASGRPVVLLHGLLFDRTMWWPVAAELAECGTVVAPDLPGHGESPPRDNVSLARIAEDLAAVIHGLDLRRAPVIVAHGTAAVLAAVFADTYATRGVITVDEPATMPGTVDDLIASARIEDVPEIFRDYARPRRDSALLSAYDGWLTAPPVRRQVPVPPLASRDTAGGRVSFGHLNDPVEFADRIKGVSLTRLSPERGEGRFDIRSPARVDRCRPRGPPIPMQCAQGSATSGSPTPGTTDRLDLPAGWLASVPHHILHGAVADIAAGRLDPADAPCFMPAVALAAFTAQPGL